MNNVNTIEQEERVFEVEANSPEEACKFLANCVKRLSCGK
ncbi:hypothetical protein [Acinetobacter phage Ab69]|nr:hypothetical protein [Acinetobacter phage Ab69]